MNIKFEPFNRTWELSNQRRLFCSCFPENIGSDVETIDHYFWKFQGIPDKKTSSYEYAAYSDDKLVGYYAALPYRYLINDKNRLCGMVCDVMTDPCMQGKGVFTKLGFYSTDELKKSGVDFTTGYPIRPEVIPGHLKVGWRIAFELPMYIKFYKVNSLFSKSKLKHLSFMINVLMSIYTFVVKNINRVNKEYSFEVFDLNNLNNIVGYDAFFQAWKKGVRNVLIKDIDFIKWRTSAPGCIYKYIVIKHKGQMIAFVIVRVATIKEIPCLAILDTMILEGHYDCISLISKVCDELARLEKAESIVIMLSRYWAKKYRLLRTGYIRSPYTFKLIIKKLNGDLHESDLFNEMNWHLMWVDSDDL